MVAVRRAVFLLLFVTIASSLATLTSGCVGDLRAGAPNLEVTSPRRQVLAERDRLEWEHDSVTPTATSTGELTEESLGETLTPRDNTEVLASLERAQLEGQAPGLTHDSVTAQLREDESLLPLLSSSTPVPRAASLRCVEKGRLLLASGQQEGAREWFERALSLDATNPYAYYFLARAALVGQRLNQAQTFLARARSLGTGLDPRWRGRLAALEGEIWEKVGRFPEARRAYQEAAEADPENPIARSGLARLGSP